MTAGNGLRTADHVLAGPHGDMRVRVYEPRTAPVAGLVWAHGGAFVHGDLDMPEADWVARSLAAAGVVVVSVDYRLAPALDYRVAGARPDGAGVRFPVPSEEVAFAFVWAAGADGPAPALTARRWSLGGASAGGDLAAGASLRLRDGAVPLGAAGGAVVPLPRSVVLAYPVTHQELPACRPELAAKVAALPQERDFPAAAVRAMNANYLGHDGPADSPYAFPGGHDLRGLPPTLVVNSDHDALRAGGEAYASELAAAGVDVALVREDGTMHGHLNRPDEPGAARTIARIAAWLTTDALVGVAHEPPDLPAPGQAVR
ncbi:alpha/beta hydrolase fold domain-containing protein [Myceligenerans xiligouense]|uniref:Acetyl esterase/lipase n=1 Tax=Myceligenerans xiligouense TaxID=253184 RepID=A0A3N4YH37_9MICO|nr:alpha/beta hydrolase fold domain-containing protein [Myceligenerans xiligouense]RPF20419.1 acetyl esterase/lipase [Myceligenerans xiligouense]